MGANIAQVRQGLPRSRCSGLHMAPWHVLSQTRQEPNAPSAWTVCRIDRERPKTTWIQCQRTWSHRQALCKDSWTAPLRFSRRSEKRLDIDRIMRHDIVRVVNLNDPPDWSFKPKSLPTSNSSAHLTALHHTHHTQRVWRHGWD